jgi:hypothetical protein
MVEMVAVAVVEVDNQIVVVGEELLINMEEGVGQQLQQRLQMHNHYSTSFSSLSATGG